MRERRGDRDPCPSTSPNLVYDPAMHPFPLRHHDLTFPIMFFMVSRGREKERIEAEAKAAAKAQILREKEERER